MNRRTFLKTAAKAAVVAPAIPAALAAIPAPLDLMALFKQCYEINKARQAQAANWPDMMMGRAEAHALVKARPDLFQLWRPNEST